MSAEIGRTEARLNLSVQLSARIDIRKYRLKPLAEHTVFYYNIYRRHRNNK